MRVVVLLPKLLVKAEAVEGFYCPVGGNDTMKAVAPILGVEAVEQKPLIAVTKV